MSPRFRKKPVVIDAMRFDGANGGEVIDWVNEFVPEDDDPGMWEDNDIDGDLFRLKIQTLEGVMAADPGDWIIRGVKGEFYPCKPDIFDATYEPVPDLDAVIEHWSTPPAAPRSETGT